VDAADLARDVWQKGDTSPVYSCYSLLQGPLDWVQASQKCEESKGSLLSVNNYKEKEILAGEMFQAVMQHELGEAAVLREAVLTSGISLASGNWTWFGAGDPVQDQDILQQLQQVEQDQDNTLCVRVSWTTQNSTDNTTVAALSFSALPCLAAAEVAVCEVRVYTQTWYVWATTNWLQILFLFSLVLLVISSCVTVQMYSSRPRQRRQEQPGRQAGSPPPYSPTDPVTSHTTRASAASKYAEKGKEMLAKIVFIRQPEDKQKLSASA